MTTDSCHGQTLLGLVLLYNKKASQKSNMFSIKRPYMSEDKVETHMSHGQNLIIDMYN